MDALMTAEEVAPVLRVKVRTLWDWRRRGVGPKSAIIGNRLVYRQVDVETYLAEMFGDVEVAG